MISTYIFNFGLKSDYQGRPRWPWPTPDDRLDRVVYDFELQMALQSILIGINSCKFEFLFGYSQCWCTVGRKWALFSKSTRNKKRSISRIPCADSTSGRSQESYESGLESGSMRPLFKLPGQCMVPVHGLNSLDTCSQTSDYFHMIPMTFQMLNLHVEFLKYLTCISSKFEELCGTKNIGQ